MRLLPFYLLVALPLLLPAQPFLPPEGMVVIDTRQWPKEPPAVYRVETDTRLETDGKQVISRTSGVIHLLEGTPKKVRLGLTGEMPIRSVHGEAIAAWGERQNPSGERSLELHLIESPKANALPREIAFEMTCQRPIEELPALLRVTLPGIGEAAGFAGTVQLLASSGFEWRTEALRGLQPLAPQSANKFQAAAQNAMTLQITRSGALPPEAEWVEASLRGHYQQEADVAAFTLEGVVDVQQENARLPILTGQAALREMSSGNGWRVELADETSTPADFTYELVFDSPGLYPIELEFDAKVIREAGWNRVDFAIPSGRILPVSLNGLPAPVTFLTVARVVPSQTNGTAKAWLAAAGRCDLGWRKSRLQETGRLFVNSTGRTDIAVGPGLIRQNTRFHLRILQGRLTELEFAMEGQGEITEVSGANVAGWKVEESEGDRQLQVRLSRPIEESADFAIRSQAVTGAFPATLEPLRLTPVSGDVRHSGMLRVRNEGAVRFDATSTNGLMQLAPGQFAPEEDQRPVAEQIQVYRFPTPDYALTLVARQVFPEVAVKQVTIHELAESDRILLSRVELDIREAPLRDWTVEIPEDYAVTSVTGTEVVDSMAGEAQEGRRSLRVVFGNPVKGRSLLEIQLEKSESAAAGSWVLPPIRFPDARTVRGFVGVKAAPGYRVAPEQISGLVETPLNFFPNQMPGLQQAFRIRESDWTATVTVEQLGQSVTANLFHLYSLKEGVAYGSVVMNFFVVGAPVNEWRLAVPENAGNLVIDGQDVQSWRRDGEAVVVTLNRPALGAATLLATFEHPMKNTGGSLSLGGVQPLEVDSERGYLQIVSPLQVKSTFQPSDSLLAIQPNELPPELRLLNNAPSLAVYQYAGRPFSLTLDVEWFAQAAAIPLVIDFAKLDTRVSRDGQVATDARYFVKSRAGGSLRLQLPPDAELWEVKTGDQIVNARVEEGATLIPLPAVMDPDQATEVSLRYGWTDAQSTRLQLAAPLADAPVLTTEWTARADTGRLLVPTDKHAVSTNRVVTQSGLAWLPTPAGLFWTLSAIILGFAALLCRTEKLWVRIVSRLLLASALGACGLAAITALTNRGVNESVLRIVAPIATDGHPVAVTVWNLPAGLAMISWWGLAFILAGLIGLVVVWLGIGRFPRLLAVVSWVAVSFGLLLQHPGAPLFFGWIALSLLVAGRRLFRGSSRPTSAAATALLLFTFGNLVMGEQRVEEEKRPNLPALGSIQQAIAIKDQTAQAEAHLSVKAREGQVFELLKPFAVLTRFEGDGLRLTEIKFGGDTRYAVTAEREGECKAEFAYRFQFPENGEHFQIPTGRAAVNTVTLRRHEPGWGFSSPQAIRVQPLEGLPAEVSGAEMVMAPVESIRINIHPRKRDAASEKLSFFAETDTLYLPRPGVIDGRHRIHIRIAQGEMSHLALAIPEGFMVGQVGSALFQQEPEVIRGWQFDPESRRLNIPFTTPKTGNYSIDLITQRPTGTLPVDVTLAPVRVIDADDAVGILGLAFGGEAQPETVTPTGMTRINFEDFDQALLQSVPSEETKLHRVFRFGQETASLDLRVTAVAPEIRVVTSQMLSIGEERVVLAVDLTADIRRAGLFQLAFPVPENFEVESVSGQSLAYWAETSDTGQRRVILHLQGRTLGETTFSLTFSRPPIGATDSWEVPRFELEEADRSRGTLMVAPEQGLRLRTVDRINVSQIDPRQAGDLQPGTLAYRLLQADWRLTLGLTKLDPWITAQLLHETEIREGQARHRVAAAYQIDNAAVKALQIQLPNLDDESANSVRANGDAISEITRLDDSDTWEIRFRRGMIGAIHFTIEYQQRLDADKNAITLHPAQPLEVRQLNAYVALRASGRLDLAIDSLASGWQRADWNAVPAPLREKAGKGLPALTLRYAEAAAPLSVSIHRQQIADALELRVAKGQLTTIFSPRGDAATRAELEVRVNEKSSLALELPPTARLFEVTVNGETMAVVRDDNRHLFYVSPSPDPNQPATVEFAYETTGDGKVSRKINLAAPAFNVPLENVEWRVLIPEGWELEDHQGDMTLRRTDQLSKFGISDYLSLASSVQAAKVKNTNKLISEAGDYLRKGDQDRARAALNQAAKTTGIDEATNEDARVQLRNLYNQQAVLGLNTVRQRLYLDNKSRDSSVVNDQIEQAANANPLLQGQSDFNLGEMSQMLQGNTMEETSALRRVADRLVSQQIAAEPAPRAIQLTLPERGTEVWFTRSVQVQGAQPLALKLAIERKEVDRTNFLPSLGLLLILAIGLVFIRPKA